MQWVQPEWIWGAVSRAIGVVYLISFVSLSLQVSAFAGSNGITPVALKLAAIARDFPGVRRFVHFPSLLWLAPRSDTWLRALPLLGALSALGVIIGGPWSTAALAACYLLYLSLDVAMRLTFPWECVLFEAGFLALLLPPSLMLPDIALSAAPAPALAWGYRILLVRVLLGFGKFKFIGSTRQDRAFLQGFLINQPLPTPLARIGAAMPIWMLEAGLWALFVVEIIFPVFALWPGPPSVVAAVGFIGLMLVIQLSGNFGFFNLLVAALSLCLFDQETPRALDVMALLSPAGWGVVELAVAAHVVAGLVHFPMNQYFSQGWLHWTVLRRVLPAPLRAPLAVLRGLHPFRWVQAYGVFPPKAMAPVRNVACLEASWDGETWQEIEPIIAPTTEHAPPSFVAPHHARYAQALIYESYGTTDFGLAYSVAGTGVPYYHARYSEARCLMQRVLEGQRYEGVVFKRGAFGNNEGAPKRVRMRTFMMVPADADDRRAGRHWVRRYVGPHQPEATLDARFWDDWLFDAELWDWDSRAWRQRSRLGPWLARARAGEDSVALVCDVQALPGAPLQPADIDVFFDDFLPAVVRPAAVPFDVGLADTVDAARSRFDVGALRTHERVLARLTHVLAAGLEQRFFASRDGFDALPTYLHLRMLCHRIIADGRDAFERARREPSFAASYATGLSLDDGMWLHALFDHRRLIAESQKIRLLDTVLVRASERFPDSPKAEYERSIDDIAKRIWGAGHLSPWLRPMFRGPRFEQGQPERYPTFELQQDGRIVPSDAMEPTVT